VALLRRPGPLAQAGRARVLVGEHVHDWLYNAASNWQSEMLFGVLVVALLHRLPGDRDET
jgi:hypothetical protein